MRQDVEQKAADEFVGRQFLLSPAVAMGGVTVGEDDLITLETQKPMVGDGHPVCVPGEIAQYVFGSAGKGAQEKVPGSFWEPRGAGERASDAGRWRGSFARIASTPSTGKPLRLLARAASVSRVSTMAATRAR
jgi:hypothetical protein